MQKYNKQKRKNMSVLNSFNSGMAAIDKVVSVPNNYPAASYTSFDDGCFPIRLIEFRPAWALHALLRFRGISYVNECLPIPYSLGLQLPVIIDGNHALNGLYALEHISALSVISQTGNDVDINTASNSMDMKEDMLVSYLERELGSVHRQICHLSGDNFAECERAFGQFNPSSWISAWKSVISNVLMLDEKDYPEVALTGGSIRDLTTRLKQTLMRINTILQQNNLYFETSEYKSKEVHEFEAGRRHRSSVSEAILFGHIAALMTSSCTAHLVSPRICPHVLKFFESVCTEYFAMPQLPYLLSRRDCFTAAEARRMVIDYRRCTNTLMENKFLVYYEQACVRNTMAAYKQKLDKIEKAGSKEGGSTMVSVPGTSALLHNTPSKSDNKKESAYGTISLYKLISPPLPVMQEGDEEHYRAAALQRLQTSLALEGASESQWMVSKLWWKPKGGEGSTWLYIRALAKSFWGTFTAPAPLRSKAGQLQEDVVNPNGSLPGHAGDRGGVMYVSAAGAVFLMAAVGGVMSYVTLSYLDKRPRWSY